MSTSNDPRYPIGPRPEALPFSPALVAEAIAKIEAAPSIIRAALAGAAPADLANTYRPGSWTALQVAHHIAESHMHAYLRLRFALTEENPTIKPYDENKGVLTADNTFELLPSTLTILEGVHGRWAALLKSLTEEQWHRTFVNPERGITYVLHQITRIYAWHGEHHAAHIRVARGLPLV